VCLCYAAFALSMAGAFYHVMSRGTIGPPGFTPEMASICQESMLTSPTLNQNAPTSVANKLPDQAI